MLVEISFLIDKTVSTLIQVCAMHIPQPRRMVSDTFFGPILMKLSVLPFSGQMCTFLTRIFLFVKNFKENFTGYPADSKTVGNF